MKPIAYINVEKRTLEFAEPIKWHTPTVANLDRIPLFTKEALAQPEQDNTYTYASSLATTIWQKHYIKDSPKWKPLDTTDGVLTQIDNMTCGLVREKSAQPEQEPVATVKDNSQQWKGMDGAIAFHLIERHADNWSDARKMMEEWLSANTTPPQRKPLTDEEIQECYSEAYKIVQGRRLEVAFARAIEAAHGIKENT